MKRIALIATAIAGAVILFSPGAQAHTTTQDGSVPCGIYSPGDGIEYYGNCTSEAELISISQPGIEPRTECVPAKSATTLGDANADWIVKDLGSC